MKFVVGQQAEDTKVVYALEGGAYDGIAIVPDGVPDEGGLVRLRRFNRIRDARVYGVTFTDEPDPTPEPPPPPPPDPVPEPPPPPDPTPEPPPSPAPGDPQIPWQGTPTDIVSNPRELFEAVRNLRPGSLVVVRNGDYRLPEGLEINGGGDRDNPAVIVAESLWGVRLWSPGTRRQMVLFDWDSHDVIFAGFDVGLMQAARHANDSGSNPSDLVMGRGIETRGRRIDVVHCYVHDCKTGIGNTARTSGEGTQNRYYGCVIMNNGWLHDGQGNGVQGYFQHVRRSESDWMDVDDCFFLGGLHPQINGQWYGSQDSAGLDGFRIRGCTFVDKFSIFGGLKDAHDMVISGNRFFDSYARVGYTNGIVHNCTFRDNLIVNGAWENGPGVLVRNQKDFVFRNNRIGTTVGQRIAAQIWGNAEFAESAGNIFYGSRLDFTGAGGGSQEERYLRITGERLQLESGINPASIPARVALSVYYGQLIYMVSAYLPEGTDGMNIEAAPEMSGRYRVIQTHAIEEGGAVWDTDQNRRITIGRNQLSPRRAPYGLTDMDPGPPRAVSLFLVKQ